MEPLKQWICDRCGDIIKSPEQGYLEWLRDDQHKAYGYKIVHQALHSPWRHEGDNPLSHNCYHYADNPMSGDGSLEEYVGPGGLVRLLADLDPGPYHAHQHSGPDVKDIREWVEICRRLHTPYYEEARIFWSAALQDGYFDGANEVCMYMPNFLKMLIQKYGKKA